MQGMHAYTDDPRGVNIILMRGTCAGGYWDCAYAHRAGRSADLHNVRNEDWEGDSSTGHAHTSTLSEY